MRFLDGTPTDLLFLLLNILDVFIQSVFIIFVDYLTMIILFSEKLIVEILNRKETLKCCFRTNVYLNII